MIPDDVFSPAGPVSNAIYVGARGALGGEIRKPDLALLHQIGDVDVSSHSSILWWGTGQQ